jgi:hypothetical protein
MAFEALVGGLQRADVLSMVGLSNSLFDVAEAMILGH